MRRMVRCGSGGRRFWHRARPPGSGERRGQPFQARIRLERLLELKPVSAPSAPLMQRGAYPLPWPVQARRELHRKPLRPIRGPRGCQRGAANPGQGCPGLAAPGAGEERQTRTQKACSSTLGAFPKRPTSLRGLASAKGLISKRFFPGEIFHISFHTVRPGFFPKSRPRCPPRPSGGPGPSGCSFPAPPRPSTPG